MKADDDPQARGWSACREPGCSGAIEASVPLWISLCENGEWQVIGVGDDEPASIRCDEYGHDNSTPILHASLSAYLEELLPGTTWVGSDPNPGTDP